MFFDQLKNLCEQNKITPTFFVKEKLHLSSSKITAWKNGSIPKYETLKEISNYFKVPVSYLFIEKYEIEDTEESRLLTAFRKLNEEGRMNVLGIAEMSADNPKYQKYTNLPKEA